MTEKLRARNVKLAVQKNGRLSDESINLLHSVGLQFDSYGQRLFATCRNFDLELLFVRDDDIPAYVADGVADLGIVGRNVVLETEQTVTDLLGLSFGYCSLVVAVPTESSIVGVKDLAHRKVATSYPNSAARYFREQGVPARIIPISGSVELTPALGVAEAVVELVATGSTLRLNDLREIATVYTSEALLIANPLSLGDDAKCRNIDRLCVRLKATIAAMSYKYVMMNAPRHALEEIERTTVGLKSPTVVKLADPDWVAVHAAVKADMFWDTIERLRELGASEILVTPIESIII